MTNRPPQKRYYPLWWMLLVVSLLPFTVLYLLSDLLYLLLYKVIGYRKKVVWQNLSRAFPEKPEKERIAIMATYYRGLCDIILETIKLGTVSAEALNKRVTILNPEILHNYLTAGTSVFTLGSHLANWEWAMPAAAAKHNFPQEAVYKPISNSFFEWYMNRSRTRLGGGMVKMKDTLRHLIRNQKNPRIIHLLSDQTPPRGEIQFWTSFLNQETPFFVGIDKLAASFKYPVVFFGAHKVKRGYYEFTLQPLYDGKSELPAGEFPLTEQYARLLETWIQQYPADYLWSHRRWKHQRVETIIS